MMGGYKGRLFGGYGKRSLNCPLSWSAAAVDVRGTVRMPVIAMAVAFAWTTLVNFHGGKKKHPLNSSELLGIGGVPVCRWLRLRGEPHANG